MCLNLQLTEGELASALAPSTGGGVVKGAVTEALQGPAATSNEQPQGQAGTGTCTV